MRILYFITSHGHAQGGHYHSLNHISRQIGKFNNVYIISIGPVISEVVSSNPHFLRHIYFKGFNIFYLRQMINKIQIEHKPEIFHFFDFHCYNIIRLLISSKKHKLVWTMCGGPNPSKAPHIQNLILFSEENLEWFKRQTKYHESKIHLVPNRVKALVPNEDSVLIAKDYKHFNFIRIGRISIGYQKSILDSIQLIKDLVTNGVPNVRLFIIGVVETVSIFETLSNHQLTKDGYVILLTDGKYTTDASKMLYFADAVIGTGRGLMEASSLAVPLLAINANGNVPVLLTEENFMDAFKTNFSERNNFRNYDYNENFDRIRQLIKDKNYRNEQSDFSREMFEKYFSIENATKLYEDIYKNSIKGNRKLIVDAKQILRSFKYYISFYLTHKRLSRQTRSS